MDCVFNKRLLSLYHDGQSSADEAERVEGHLSFCSVCQEELARIKELSGVLGKLKAVKPSPDYELKFQRRLEEKLRLEQKSPAIEKVLEVFKAGLDSLLRVLSPVPALAKVAIVLAVFIGLGYFGGNLYRISLPAVISVKGNVETYQPQSQEWKLAQFALKLRPGDIIRTGENSFVDIESNRAYKLRIKENSEVIVTRLVLANRHASTWLNVSQGEVLVDIGERFKGKEFKIDTVSGSAVARGTEFLVDVDPRHSRMWLGVLEGEVGVKALNGAPLIMVKAKEKVEVFPDARPQALPLTAEELERLKEIEEIGRLLVSLVLTDTPARVREFLRSPRFYSYGKEPLKVQRLLKETVYLLNAAIREKSREKHLKCISKLEKIIQDYPDTRYNPQLLVFIGGYYAWLGLEQEAIEVFRQVSRAYPDSEVASIATCAAGIIEEKRGNFGLARSAYQKVLSDYPASLETAEARQGLERLP